MEEKKPIVETNQEEKAVENSVPPQKLAATVKQTATRKSVVKKEVELPATAATSPIKRRAAAQKPVVEIIVPAEKIQTEANESAVAIEEKNSLAKNDKLKIKKSKKMSTKLTEKEKKEKAKKKEKLAVAKSKQMLKEKKAKKKKKEKAKKEKSKKKLKEKTSKKKAAAKKKKAKAKSKKK
jgi:adenylate kinase/ribonuclease R